jgi:hypothetical protein
LDQGMIRRYHLLEPFRLSLSVRTPDSTRTGSFLQVGSCPTLNYLGSTAYLASRDINPLGPPVAGNPVISPLEAEIMIVDTTLSAEPDFPSDNAGLGYFVALRIPMGTLPQILKDEIRRYYSESRIPTTSSGYLYIGYAHLSQVEVVPRQVVTRGQVLGYSGDTGFATAPHLDVTAYYIPERGPASGVLPIPEDTYWQTSPYAPDQLPFWYNSYYTLFLRPNIHGLATSIDPLVLWPSLNVGCIYPANPG